MTFAPTAIAALGLAVLAASANATAFSSAGLSRDNALLGQFSLVVPGKATTGGRGADATGELDGSVAKFSALAVFGNLMAPGASTGAALKHAGRGLQANALGLDAVSQTIASVFPFAAAYRTEATTPSDGIAALPGSPGVRTEKPTAGSGIFFTVSNGANSTLPNLNSYAGSSKGVLDFVDAPTLKSGGNGSGVTLAPLAAITGIGRAMDGSAIVNSINQMQALYSPHLFAGDSAGRGASTPRLQ